MKKNRTWATMLFIYILLLYLFSEQITISTIGFVVSVVVFSLFTNSTRWRVTPSTLFLLIYIIYGSVLTLFYPSINLYESFEFIGSLVIGIIINSYRIDVTDEFEYENRVQFKIILGVCIVVVIGAVMQLLFPNALDSINQLRMGPEKYSWYLDFKRSGFIVGFSFQTAVTGFYLSILTCVLFMIIIEKKSVITNWKYIIAMLGTFMLTFLTGKRIFIFATIIVCFAVYLFNYRKNIIRTILLFSVMMIVVVYLFNNTIIGDRLIYRMNLADSSRGRIGIYTLMLDGIAQNPIFGHGLTSTTTYIKNYLNGHNIYLQLLYETGIIGFAIMTAMFVLNLIRGIKVINAYKGMGKEIYICFSCLAIELLFLMWGFTGNPLYDTYPFLIYMIAVSIIDNDYTALHSIGRR